MVWKTGLSAVVFYCLLALLGPPANSPASAKCDPGRPDFGYQLLQSGWKKYPAGYTVGGVYSAVLNYSPWVSPTTQGNSTGWVMVDQQGEFNWAQTGWMEEPYDPGNQKFAGRWVFTQWTVNGSPNAARLFLESDAEADVGKLFYYTVLYNNEPGQFTFYYKGNRVDGGNATWVPNRGITAGEIHTLSSQMPGGTGSEMWMADTHIWYTDAWRDFSGLLL